MPGGKALKNENELHEIRIELFPMQRTLVRCVWCKRLRVCQKMDVQKSFEAYSVLFWYSFSGVFFLFFFLRSNIWFVFFAELG